MSATASTFLWKIFAFFFSLSFSLVAETRQIATADDKQSVLPFRIPQRRAERRRGAAVDAGAHMISNVQCKGGDNKTKKRTKHSPC